MCTSIAIFDSGVYGRTLDVERGYGERVIFLPRGSKIPFLYKDAHPCRFSVVGMGVLLGENPLFFDGLNSCGLFGAALRFPHLCRYFKRNEKKRNIASFELLSYVLSECESVFEVRQLLSSANITDDSVAEDMPPSPLHWFFADRSGAVTVESTEEGLSVIDNPVGVMTNSPELRYHLLRLCDVRGLSAENPDNKIGSQNGIPLYSGGMGAIGLPGDFSSSSRFLRAAFLSTNAIIPRDFPEASGAFLNLLENLSVPLGAVRKKEGATYTKYASCAHFNSLTYSFRTAQNHRVRTVRLQSLSGDRARELFNPDSAEDVEFIE